MNMVAAGAYSVSYAAGDRQYIIGVSLTRSLRVSVQLVC